MIIGLAESYGISVKHVTREFYFNVGGPAGFMRWGIYLFAAAAVAYLIYTIIQRVKIWKLGKPEIRTDKPVARMIAVVKYVMFQAKIFKEGYGGIMHASFFFGFVGLFIVTMIIVVQEDFTGLFFHYHFITGNFYLIWSLFGDMFGLVVLLGLAMAIFRRYILAPKRLDNQATDLFALGLILFIVITGFTNEALRIAITHIPDFEIWSPVGYAYAHVFKGVEISLLKKSHYLNWWLHMIASFTFIGLIASNKIGHIFVGFLNVYFMNLDNESPKTKYTLPVIDPKVFETAETFGISKIEEYTWKQMMDSAACTRCGRCQDNCPAYLTEKPLSPKKLINDIKDNIEERAPKLLAASDPAAVESTELIGGSVQPDEFWSCTNCGACMEACPVNIEHVPKMLGMRQHKVLMEGEMAAELQATFTKMESNFNPYGFGFSERGAWVPEDLGVKTLAEDPNVDYVYFVGCSASYDKRNQKVAIALLSILKKAGVKVGILGAEETCCGDSALRAGNEYLFHTLAAQNLEVFKTYGIKKIITTCPHGYNVLKKEYKKFAPLGTDSEGKPFSYDVEIYHHTEIISELIKSGKIKLKEALKDKITYHDSCFLGRYNEIYDAPRSIIKAIPGSNLVEMSRHHDTSFCCGAGGSRMWIEEHLGSRVNQFRTKDANSTGAATVGTACPFCLTMLSDGANELDMPNLAVLDLAELVNNSMEK